MSTARRHGARRIEGVMNTSTTPASTSGGEAGVEVGQPRVFDATDRAVLEFERSGTWKYAGEKISEIRTRFAMSEVRYYQVLNWIIDQPEAVAYDAVLVRRLLRLRELRRSVRTRGTTAAGVTTRPDMRGIRPALGGAL